MQNIKRLGFLGLILIFSLTALAQGLAGLPQGGSKSLVKRQHVGYAVAYDTSKLCPAWVAWRLTASRLTKNVERKNKFKQEPDLKHCSATHEDYTKSGCVRRPTIHGIPQQWPSLSSPQTYVRNCHN